MFEKETGVAAGTGNLDDLLGAPPVAEAMPEDSLEPEVIEEKPSKSEEKTKEPKKEESKDEKPSEEEPREKKFSHGALHEERERRKELATKLKAEEERNQRLEERQSKIMEALAARSAPAEEQQEYVDPLVRLENEVRSVKESVQKSQAQIETENKAILEEQRLIARYKGSVDAFTKDAPDFMEARNYLINDKIKELKALDYNDAEIAHEIKTIEKQIVERAYSKEQNPAEVIFKIAAEKGYKKPETKTIEDIDKGLKASKSLGNGGSVVRNDSDLKNLSAQDLSDMSDEEFNAQCSR
jgi:hypothetical protein